MRYKGLRMGKRDRMAEVPCRPKSRARSQIFNQQVDSANSVARLFQSACACFLDGEAGKARSVGTRLHVVVVVVVVVVCMYNTH